MSAQRLRETGIRTEQRERPIYDSTRVGSMASYELRNLLHYRFLIVNLISRDLKLRYKRSYLGFIWAMLGPLLIMGVISLVFSQLFRSEVEHYPIYILTGLIMWNLFSQGTLSASMSLLSNSDILKRIYVPASAFVVATFGAGVVNALFALIPLLILSLAFGVRPAWSWFFIPVPILMISLFGLGVALLVSSLIMFFNDAQNIYEVLLSAFFYFSPVMYPLSILPSQMAEIAQYNPMAIFLAIFRSAVIGGQIAPAGQMGSGLAFSAIAVLLGWMTFTLLSRRFAYRT